MRRTVLVLVLVVLMVAVWGCSKNSVADGQASNGIVTGEGSLTFSADVWADNWFALYVGDALIKEDSVPITTERSFNAESFTFKGDYPLVLNFIVKDFKENDTGLEYIGAKKQQMGDGGFVAQVKDSDGGVVAVTDGGWRCLVIHKAPLDKSCEDSSNPEADCTSEISEEPGGWKDAGYDTSGWEAATVYTVDQVSPKKGYDRVSWADPARLIWTSDLETDNTLLCKLTVEAP